MCSLPQKLRVPDLVKTPCQEHTDALYCCCSCKATATAVRFFITSRCVLGSPHGRSFHRVHPAWGGGASFFPGPFWDPSESVPGSSGAFLERSRFVPWPFRGFSPEESPMGILVARIQFRMEAAACWPIIAVVGLSILSSGPKHDVEVCGCSAGLESL